MVRAVVFLSSLSLNQCLISVGSTLATCSREIFSTNFYIITKVELQTVPIWFRFTLHALTRVFPYNTLFAFLSSLFFREVAKLSDSFYFSPQDIIARNKSKIMFPLLPMGGVPQSIFRRCGYCALILFVDRVKLLN